jgi:hypothetical protein
MNDSRLSAALSFLISQQPLILDEFCFICSWLCYWIVYIRLKRFDPSYYTWLLK